MVVVGMNTVCCHIRALGGERGLVGKDEGGLIAIEELYKEVEGLPGGDGMGDKRKFRMRRSSAELDRGGTSSWSIS